MTDKAEERKLFVEGFMAGWRSIPEPVTTRASKRPGLRTAIGATSI